MRWSKVRKLVHDSFADSVRGRVKVNITNIPRHNCAYCHQGWISVDEITVAHAGVDIVTLSLPVVRESQERVALATKNLPWEPIFMDLQRACWQYLHSSLNESLASPDPFVSSLAVLNAKVGRTRLQRALTWDLHTLTRAMAGFRLEAEREARRAA